MIRIFGKPVRAGRLVRRLGRARVEAVVERHGAGLSLRGTLSGRPGRIEIVRAPAPPEFLLNSWQSWGPMQKVRPSDTFPELGPIFESYSPYVFSPVPEDLRRGPVSDYFTAWDGMVCGFLTSRIGHPFFSLEGGDIVGWLEYFDAEFDDPVPLEPLAVLEGAAVEDLLDVFGGLAKRANRVRINPWNPVGWCSWYHYFGNLKWRDVLDNLAVAARDREGFPFEVFQVDDGFEIEIGDWLRPRAGYPDIGGLARAIRAKGFKAGIWTAPTSAAETSELFSRHSDWMVTEGGRPKVCYKGWGKAIYALDVTHPEVKAWLYETFSALRKAGFSYFKIDFLFAGAVPGSRRKSLTPIQAYREGLKVIRAAVGDGFVLGCGAPLLPSAGLVDGMRIGEDTAPYWKTKPSAFQGPNAYFALKNALMRAFMHGALWLNDPDCLLLRGRETELRANERELYALAAGALDNLVIVSDDLSLLGEKEKGLLRRSLKLRGGRSRVSGLLGEDGCVIRSERGPAGRFDLAVNLSDGTQAIEGEKVPPRSAAFITP